ncbi:hypothetical protein [Altererythrobacter sp.]|uniref:hypothetical protein n=1 Tax=Altererythrobacter sp. TaxID=1872480 RepID=UPI003D02B68E
MGLFKADLYRNFAIGFAVGTLLVGAMTAQDWNADLAAPAYAATGEAQTVSE